MSASVLENEIRFCRKPKSERLPTLFKHLVYIMGTVVRDLDLRNTKVETLARDNDSKRSMLVCNIKEYFFVAFM